MISQCTIICNSKCLKHVNYKSKCLVFNYLTCFNAIFLEEEMATHSSILAWKIPCPVGYSLWVSKGKTWLSDSHVWRYLRASLGAQMVKNPPAMQETWVRSLGWEDPLEKGMPTHSSILAWRIPWTEEPGSYRAWHRRVRHDGAACTFEGILTVSLSCSLKVPQE